METCVLIPAEFSLVLSPCATDSNANRLYEMGVRIWSNQLIPQGTRFSPYQGTIRLDRLEVYSLLDDNDVRQRFGCYDEIQEVESQQVRHCNWIRFLRHASDLSSEVNLLGIKIRPGETVYETTASILPNTEMVVYYGLTQQLPIISSTPISSRHHAQLCRQRIEESPLDLSMSLVSLPPCSSSSSWENSPNSISAGEVVTSKKGLRERSLLPCSYCGKAFDRPSLLRRHMRTHTGEKPHVCDVCSKGFSTSSSLNTHRRIHSGEKPHQCNVCGKRFTASSNLYYHRMTHNKEKPHKCGLCAKSFPTPGDLKSHMYVHNGSWPFKCHVCSRGFSKQTNLRNHLFLHSGDRPHTCDICQKRFALACNLRAHLKTHHDGETGSSRCQRCSRPASVLTLGCCHDCFYSNPLLRRTPELSS